MLRTPDEAYQLARKKLLESPKFSGIPEAPTAPEGTDSEQIATTAFVANALSEINNVATLKYVVVTS